MWILFLGVCNSWGCTWLEVEDPVFEYEMLCRTYATYRVEDHDGSYVLKQCVHLSDIDEFVSNLAKKHHMSREN